MKQSLVKIRIMCGVATKVRNDARMIRALGLFYVLKAMYKNGYIRNADFDLPIIAAACHCSEKTLLPWIKLLQEFKLAQVHWATVKSNKKGGEHTILAPIRIRLISSAQLHELLEVKKDIKYHYRRVSTKPGYILRALEIAENYRNQERIIHRKIKQAQQRGRSNYYPVAAVAIKAEYARLEALFIKRWKPVNFIDDNFDFNPDISFSQENYRRRLGLASDRSGHYWQHRLQSLGLIRIEQRRINSEVGCPGSPLGFRHWNRKEGTAFIVQRNKIHFTQTPQ